MSMSRSRSISMSRSMSMMITMMATIMMIMILITRAAPVTKAEPAVHYFSRYKSCPRYKSCSRYKSWHPMFNIFPITRAASCQSCEMVMLSDSLSDGSQELSGNNPKIRVSIASFANTPTPSRGRDSRDELTTPDAMD
eukprot:2983954-Karenia_brevis.AAC.1